MATSRVPNQACPQCSQPFYASPARIARTKGVMYCSRACQSAAAQDRPPKPANRTCERCGAPFYAKPGDVRRGFGRFCSKECSSLSTVPRGERSNRWTGGVYYNHGYRMIKTQGHPRATKHGYVAEHVLVMEAHIGRALLPHEEVHHINRVKDDNRIENLALMDRSEHHRLHNREMRFERNGQTVSCPVCAAPFYRFPGSHRQTCSRKCGQAWRRQSQDQHKS